MRIVIKAIAKGSDESQVATYIAIKAYLELLQTTGHLSHLAITGTPSGGNNGEQESNGS